MKGISLVAPLYNEEGNVTELHRQIDSTLEGMKLPYEIIFVDDGSTDQTVPVAKSLYPLKLICLRRNFGQTAAMDAGIHAAQYDYIVTIDGDLQNDPVDIPKMIAYLEENDLDVVSGWRRDRKDSFFKRVTSRGANLLRWLIVRDGIHDSGCSLKVYKRECFEGVRLFGEMHRFIPALLKIKGFRIGEMAVNHRPRTAGVTKYNWKRTVKGFVDMISLWFWSKFASRPLHLFGTVGLLLLFGGSVTGIVSVVKFLIRGEISNTGWPILTALLLIAGIQFFVFGLIADIVSKTYREMTDDKSYSIRETVDTTAPSKN
jgi:glycosyltransferase involved in cell wall biosynthesis